MSMNPECTDKSLLMAHLYGECDAREREAFERHLAVCADCRREAQELRGVRGALQQWTPPDVDLGFRVVRDGVSAGGATTVPFAAPAKKERSSRRLLVPAWAQLAAAVLVLAVGAAIANLDVQIGSGGVTVRTGWQDHASDQATAAKGASPVAQPWRADLARFEEKMRREMSAQNVAVPVQASAPGVTAPGPTRGLTAAETGELLRRVDEIVAQSERRQQQAFEGMLATRMVQFGRDVNNQWRTEFVRFQQGVGQVDFRTTSEIAQIKAMQNYLMRVANVQEIK